MRVQPVDERDGHREDSGLRFQVSVFRGGDEPMRSWSTATDAHVGAPDEDEQRWLDAVLERRAEYRRGAQGQRR